MGKSTGILPRIPQITRIRKEKIRGNPFNPWQKEKDDTIWALRDALVDFLPRITRISRRKAKNNSSNSSNSWLNKTADS